MAAMDINRVLAIAHLSHLGPCRMFVILREILMVEPCLIVNHIDFYPPLADHSRLISTIIPDNRPQNHLVINI